MKPTTLFWNRPISYLEDAIGDTSLLHCKYLSKIVHPQWVKILSKINQIYDQIYLFFWAKFQIYPFLSKDVINFCRELYRKEGLVIFLKFCVFLSGFTKLVI
jgi:hypothetical protein